MKTHPNLNKLIALTGAFMPATLGAIAKESSTGHYNPGQTADFGLRHTLKRIGIQPNEKIRARSKSGDKE
jgi:hypothetical protein